MADIADVIIRRKDELGLSYEDIARKSGLSDSSVKRIADGTTKDPKIGSMLALSRALEMTFFSFLNECGYFLEVTEDDI